MSLNGHPFNLDFVLAIVEKNCRQPHFFEMALIVGPEIYDTVNTFNFYFVENISANWAHWQHCGAPNAGVCNVHLKIDPFKFSFVQENVAKFSILSILGLLADSPICLFVQNHIDIKKCNCPNEQQLHWA